MKNKNEIQLEALEAIGSNRRSGLSISVGVGKTLIGLKFINKNYKSNLKVLIVAPKVSIFESWKEECEKFFLSHLISHITFTTYLSLDKQDLDYDIIILDEVHAIMPHHTEYLRSHQGKILGLSGTFPKYEDSERGKLIQEFCPVIYEYITDDAVEDGILNDYRIIVHPVQLSKANTMLMKTKFGKKWMTSEQKNYDYWTQRVAASSTPKEKQIMSIMRMKALMDFPTKVAKAKELFNSINDKVILFCNTQKQSDELSLHSYHSNNPLSEDNLELFKEGKIKKLSAVLQLSEGVNIPNLKSGIIMHSYSGSSPKSKQKFGRLLRLNPNETCELHFLYYPNTIDEKWCKSALSDLNETKITWL